MDERSKNLKGRKKKRRRGGRKKRRKKGRNVDERKKKGIRRATEINVSVVDFS